MRYLIAAGVLFMSNNLSLAQNSFGGDAPKEAQKTLESISALDFLMMGGAFLIPIVILLFYTLVVITERFLYLRRVAKHNKNFISNLNPLLDAGKFDEALVIAKNVDNAYGRVIQEGLVGINNGLKKEQIESRMEKVANIEIGKMEKNLGHLGLIAGIAPTLGFIGTISGVIKIFYQISITENVSIGNISGGLYEKMISSGAGLVVGMIAYAGYHILNSIIDSYALKVQEMNMDFFNSSKA